MTQQEFDLEMNRLVSFYGDKAYPTERIDLIYKSLRWQHPEVWNKAVDLAMADSEKAPLLAKLTEFVNRAKSMLPDLKADDPYAPIRAQIDEAMKSKNPCYKCGNSGLIIAYRKWQGLSEAVLACNCQWGDVAVKVPEYREVRRIQAHDPFYYVLKFDVNKREKFEIYGDLPWRANASEAVTELAERYYTRELNMKPLFWSHQGVQLSGFEKPYYGPTGNPQDLANQLAGEKRMSTGSQKELEPRRLQLLNQAHLIPRKET